MTIKLGIVMDDIAKIKVQKDTTFAFMLEAQRRGWQLYYMQQNDIYYTKGAVYSDAKEIEIQDDMTNWYKIRDQQQITLNDLDVILMRKDPPVNAEYIYTTYLLELVEKTGVQIVNAPQALRDANEKLSITWFLQCCTDTLVTSCENHLRQFIKEQKDVVLKPLDGMGGQLIFRVCENDPNLSVIIETLTLHGKRTIMAQRYLPEIAQGDKRILLIDGKPIDFALARIPMTGETRGNLAAGGKGVAVPLTERDYWICEQVGKPLRDRGLLFVGLDVIGDYLTEVNVTSPTCVRELDKQCGLNISAIFLDCIEKKL